MLYTDFLKDVKVCQFCDFNLDKMIKKDENAFLTYSIAPYGKHHLLVIPNRHVEHFEDLNKEEKESIDNLLNSGIKLLRVLGHDGYNILLRSGNNSGKSVNHLHYHLIPSIEIGIQNSHEREIMTIEEINKFIEDFKEAELEIEN
jgi:diadenosine tetraphosphate (Ap4A) HIT family hydrolase